MLLANSRLKQNASTLPNAFEKFYKLVKSLLTRMFSSQLGLRKTVNLEQHYLSSLFFDRLTYQINPKSDA